MLCGEPLLLPPLMTCFPLAEGARARLRQPKPLVGVEAHWVRPPAQAGWARGRSCAISVFSHVYVYICMGVHVRVKVCV